MSPRSNRKPALGQRSTSKINVTFMSHKLKPAIWSPDTGQRIPCFHRCQLIIIRMSNIKEVHSKQRVHVSVKLLFGFMAAILRNSSVAAIVRTRPRAIPLAMITMRKSTHGGFHFASHMSMGLRLTSPEHR